jgi:heme-degrading monooxygenase HmoA
MIVSLSILKYPKKNIAFAFLAMALHRLPLLLNKKCSFWKLMGSGKNGTFDINPDYQQWALLAVWDTIEDFENFNKHSFIARWWNRFTLSKRTLICEPLEAHGKWDNQQPFGNPKIKDHKGAVAILTRATIRPSRLKNFWKNVPRVAAIMSNTEGFITSVGIGEAPFFRQATFSIWRSLDDVKKFAYKDPEHAEIIRLTRQENWYSEELFARFKIIRNEGFY